MNWNQPACDPCYREHFSSREPVRIKDVKVERCAWCGRDTGSGIYVRAHPSSVPFPAPEDDDE